MIRYIVRVHDIDERHGVILSEGAELADPAVGDTSVLTATVDSVSPALAAAVWSSGDPRFVSLQCMPIELENVGIAVHDIEAAIAFFTDLGLVCRP